MYKLVACWTPPDAESQGAFEQEYWDVHVPLAAKVPRLRQLVLTHTTDGLEGGATAFYRVAELVWDSKEDFEACADTPEWAALREDAGRLIDAFNVELEVGLGEATIYAGP